MFVINLSDGRSLRYDLLRIGNAFPTFLNGQTISGTRTLKNGDVL